jgi:hypothetical protein
MREQRGDQQDNPEGHLHDAQQEDEPPKPRDEGSDVAYVHKQAYGTNYVDERHDAA